MSVEEKIEALTKNVEYLRTRCDEKEAQNDYLRKQLDTFMKEKRRSMRSSSSSRGIGSIQTKKGGKEELSEESSNEDESPRFPRKEPRQPNNFNDFKVDIPEFEGRLDPDDFLEWIQTDVSSQTKPPNTRCSKNLVKSTRETQRDSHGQNGSVRAEYTRLRDRTST